MSRRLQLMRLSVLVSGRILLFLVLCSDSGGVGGIDQEDAQLVDNAGIDSGDVVGLTGNPLSQTSTDVHIPEFEARGVTVLK